LTSIAEIQSNRPAGEVVISEALNNNQSKTVFIFRGLPGSGKSFLASKVSLHALANGRTVRHCSDDFFYFGSDGMYQWHNWDADHLHAASASTKQQYLAALQEGCDTICIDNIHHRAFMYTEYVKLGLAFGYRVHVIEIPCQSISMLANFFSRSKKCDQRTAGTITQHGQGYSWQDVLRLYSGWEADRKTSKTQPWLAPALALSPSPAISTLQNSGKLTPFQPQKLQPQHQHQYPVKAPNHFNQAHHTHMGRHLTMVRQQHVVVSPGA
jgi:hypothetical protein